MKPITILFVFLTGCASATNDANSGTFQAPDAVAHAALIELADSVFAAARSRSAERFASYFLDAPGFAYLINKRQLKSVAELRETFSRMLASQQSFEPRWGDRRVQMINATAGIVTGEFSTSAVRSNGESWGASGVITFVALRDRTGWRVVNWHTSE
jgi:hypothetical protein